LLTQAYWFVIQYSPHLHELLKTLNVLLGLFAELQEEYLQAFHTGTWFTLPFTAGFLLLRCNYLILLH